jgi:hypothetical protein
MSLYLHLTASLWAISCYLVHHSAPDEEWRRSRRDVVLVHKVEIGERWRGSFRKCIGGRICTLEVRVVKVPTRVR